MAQDRNTERNIDGLISWEPIFSHFVETGLGCLCLCGITSAFDGLVFTMLPWADMPMENEQVGTGHRHLRTMRLPRGEGHPPHWPPQPGALLLALNMKEDFCESKQCCREPPGETCCETPGS